MIMGTVGSFVNRMVFPVIYYPWTWFELEAIFPFCFAICFIEFRRLAWAKGTLDIW